MNWYLNALKKYADFDGRARRKEYWMFLLFNMLITYGLAILALLIDTPKLLFVVVIYVLATIIPSVSVSVRRMHDISKSGWYALIPYYSIYLACLESEFEYNQYGENPKKTPDAILQKV